ncbi:Putative serine protease HhoB [Ascidiaceihabitans donghaensis]|uniref:Serine protease HhoB n=1 Tax=Ascidiaceihabitans donghaensis TaxID=1510460 RepID=A0A2R8BPP6_9RHOB|nr:trypsin-like peptidase domain-containing protein [Ascidiaceihabitans donghaensis]SPH27578.1 Putative serine protease HhoB [Ascidiaceihabitans donghaensis]
MRLITLAIFITLGWFAPDAARATNMTKATTDRVLASTVIVRSDDGRNRFLGSGFVVRDKKTVVSNAHVIGNAGRVMLVFQDGTRMAARVMRIDKMLDLSVLETEKATSVDPLQLDVGAVHPGHTVYATGAPLEAGFSLTAGIVSARARQVDATQPLLYVQHSASVNPGSSGGPLLNFQGGVLGVNTRISDGSRFFVGIAYAISAADVSEFLSREPGPEILAPGMKVRPFSPRIRTALGFEGQGVLVDLVRPNSPASRAGMQAGDILTVYGATQITTPGDLAFALRKSNIDTDIEVIRENRTITLTVDRTPLPASLNAMTTNAAEAIETYGFADMGLTINVMGTIDAVSSNGTGFFVGLSKGDRIDAINGRGVETFGPDWPQTFQFDEPLLLRIVLPDGATQHYMLDPWDDGVGLRPSSGANVLDQEVVSFD